MRSDKLFFALNRNFYDLSYEKRGWNMKKWIGVLLFAALTITMAACGRDLQTKQTKSSDQIKVMTTFYPMYEFTKEVVGQAGEVSLLIPAGTEPHDFEPSAKDMAKIMKSDVFVYNSDELETWVKSAKENLTSSKTTVIQAARAIQLAEAQPAAEDSPQEKHQHTKDPHVWLDPVLAMQEVQTIEQQLSKKYPQKQEIFAQNAASYRQKLQKLDQDYHTALQSAQKRTFVTQHAAFGYLAKQYDITQIAIAGVSAEQEPSPSRLAELKSYVKENHIEVLYFEENASSKVARTLATETGVKLAVLNPLESLTKQQIQAGDTYLSVMQANLVALKQAIY